ncbi:DUF2793 domain-containing protein [Pacificoceanicola onchidii]|uniref:DUF2793 domain-containing protein n=1 Tax=Pacificoceanicola onchidii TaxID=2562685 RepID=UPI0010A5B519|nr:DUF2793 domain-containing protein [Pacificoceanicola onchidii]
MDTSARLSLPYLMPAQAQKHVTHNAALERLDIVVQLTIEEFDASAPPVTPVAGGVWALGLAPSGAWDGHGGDLAAWIDDTWIFVTPVEGWIATDKPGGGLRLYAGGIWSALSTGGGGGGGGTPSFDNLDGIGIGTTHDTTNRLSVVADASLLSHDGTGHQMKINKASATDTASLLFQTNWSGRAEMGTTGSDNFAVKVSADGTAWTEAMVIDGANGNIGLGMDSPNYPLHIHRPGGQGAALQMSNDNSGSGTSDGFWFGFSNRAYFWNYEATDIQFATDNAARMTIAPDGKVGIGTTTPASTLDVSGPVRCGAYASGARPDAAAAGAGAMIYDSTLNKPLWSDGTIWRLSGGAAA